MTNINCSTRFAFFLFLILAVNAIPFALTIGDYKTDGYEIAGFPFRFYQYGGLAGSKTISVWAIITNFTIALLAATAATWILSKGPINTIKRWKIGALQIPTK